MKMNGGRVGESLENQCQESLTNPEISGNLVGGVYYFAEWVDSGGEWKVESVDAKQYKQYNEMMKGRGDEGVDLYSVCLRPGVPVSRWIAGRLEFREIDPDDDSDIAWSKRKLESRKLADLRVNPPRR